jgi:hypothetical protein
VLHVELEDPRLERCRITNVNGAHYDFRAARPTLLSNGLETFGISSD